MVRPYIDETKIMGLPAYKKLLDEEDYESFDDYAERAQSYIESFAWCDEVREVKVGLFFPGILGVFLAEIETTLPEVDDRIWVIIGNLPPAYIADENLDCPNAAQALDGYVGAMFEWVKAVEERRSIDNVIPVNVPPTKEWAKELRGRLEFIDENILPDYKAFLS